MILGHIVDNIDIKFQLYCLSTTPVYLYVLYCLILLLYILNLKGSLIILSCCVRIFREYTFLIHQFHSLKLNITD